MFIVIILLLHSWIVWLTGKMLNSLSRNKGLKEKKTGKQIILLNLLFKILVLLVMDMVQFFSQ